MIQQKPSTRGRLGLGVVGLLPERATRRVLEPISLVVGAERTHATLDLAGESYVVDHATMLVCPHRATARATTRAAGGRLFFLRLTDDLIEKTARAFVALGVDAGQFRAWLTVAELLPRTVWVHEIVHRYVFERTVLAADDNVATRFLETEIAKEIFFLLRDRKSGTDRASSAHRHSEMVERALARIESRLFAPEPMAALAKAIGTSESSLLRAFRRELGHGPGEHWRARRLEESLVLLRSGYGTISEVALRVGYENPASFTVAFREHFGKPPSVMVQKRPTRRSPS